MAKKTAKKTKKLSSWRRIFDHFSFRSLAARRRAFLGRRPHRSFKKTNKHDLPSRPHMPGYIALTTEVLRTMRRFWPTMLFFTFFYACISSIIIGFIQQQNYHKILETFEKVGSEMLRGQYDRSVEVFSAAGVIVTGGLNGPLSEAQQLSMLFLGLIVWLCVVWYLRHRLAGKNVRIRDALYNACAPLVSTLMLGFVLLVQLLPALIGIFLYVTAALGGVLESGVESMVFGIAVLLMVVLSLYWVTATEFALIIVTLPGMYPGAALREAGDIAIGRRLPLALRLLWLLACVLVVWFVILMPLVWLNSLSWLQAVPLVPIVSQGLAGATAVFTATYIYLLYRRLIDV